MRGNARLGIIFVILSYIQETRFPIDNFFHGIETNVLQWIFYYNALGAFLKPWYNALVVAQTCFGEASLCNHQCVVHIGKASNSPRKTEILFYSVQLYKLDCDCGYTLESILCVEQI